MMPWGRPTNCTGKHTCSLCVCFVNPHTHHHRHMMQPRPCIAMRTTEGTSVTYAEYAKGPDVITRLNQSVEAVRAETLRVFTRKGLMSVVDGAGPGVVLPVDKIRTLQAILDLIPEVSLDADGNEGSNADMCNRRARSSLTALLSRAVAHAVVSRPRESAASHAPTRAVLQRLAGSIQKIATHAARNHSFDPVFLEAMVDAHGLRDVDAMFNTLASAGTYKHVTEAVASTCAKVLSGSCSTHAVFAKLSVFRPHLNR